jgi:hypothetical protein
VVRVGPSDRPVEAVGTFRTAIPLHAAPPGRAAGRTKPKTSGTRPPSCSTLAAWVPGSRTGPEIGYDGCMGWGELIVAVVSSLSVGGGIGYLVKRRLERKPEHEQLQLERSRIQAIAEVRTLLDKGPTEHPELHGRIVELLRQALDGLERPIRGLERGPRILLPTAAVTASLHSTSEEVVDAGGRPDRKVKEPREDEITREKGVSWGRERLRKSALLLCEYSLSAMRGALESHHDLNVVVFDRAYAVFRVAAVDARWGVKEGSQEQRDIDDRIAEFRVTAETLAGQCQRLVDELVAERAVEATTTDVDQSDPLGNTASRSR